GAEETEVPHDQLERVGAGGPGGRLPAGQRLGEDAPAAPEPLLPGAGQGDAGGAHAGGLPRGPDGARDGSGGPAGVAGDGAGSGPALGAGGTAGGAGRRAGPAEEIRVGRGERVDDGRGEPTPAERS